MATCILKTAQHSFITKIHSTHLSMHWNELNHYHIICWTFIYLTQNTEQELELQTFANKA